MQIGIATKDDLPQLTELLAQLFSLEHEFIVDANKQQQGLIEILANPGLGTVFVSKENDHVVAMLTVLYSISTALGGRVATFEDMIVAEPYRAKGVGSAIINHALEYVKNIGCLRVSLLTDADNEQAHRFYQQQGFDLSTMRLFRKLLN